jgi:repressor LexA
VAGRSKQEEPGGEVHALPDGPPDITGLTPRQRRVLEVIRDSVDRRGYPPSMREIGDAVGLTSTSSVSHQLTTLERKGYLRRDPNRPRAVEVRLPDAGEPDGSDTHEAEWRASRPAAAYVPVVGRIAAGGPILAEQAVDAAICDGDWVVVRQQSVAENGDIVAAMLDGEATVKTFKRRGGRIWLMPHNQAYEPIAGEFATILGKVVSVLRRI